MAVTPPLKYGDDDEHNPLDLQNTNVKNFFFILQIISIEKLYLFHSGNRKNATHTDASSLGHTVAVGLEIKRE